jgi:hypothetical protein
MPRYAHRTVYVKDDHTFRILDHYCIMQIQKKTKNIRFSIIQLLRIVHAHLYALIPFVWRFVALPEVYSVNNVPVAQ